MSVIVLDRTSDEIKGELNVENGLISAVYKRDTGEEGMSLEVSIFLDSEVPVLVGDSLIITDEIGKFREFMVQDIEELDGEVGDIVCIPTYLEDLGLSEPKLVNEKLTREGAIEDALKSTIWVLGARAGLEGRVSEVLEKEEGKEDENEYLTALGVINKALLGLELLEDYEIILRAGRLPERVVNLRRKKEVRNGKEFERGKDLTSLKRRESIADIETAVKVIGQKIEKRTDSEGNEVEIKEDVVVTLVNEEIQKKYGKPNNYKWGILEVDSDDKEVLKRAGRNYLKDKARVQESFEVDVADLGSYFSHERVEFGDYVVIKETNYKTPLVVEGVVVGIEYDLVNEWDRKYVIGDIVSFKSAIEEFREAIGRTSIQVRNSIEGQEEIRRRLISVAGDTGEKGKGFVYKNELRSNMFERVGNYLNHPNYESLLGVEVVGSSVEELISDRWGSVIRGYPLIKINNLKKIESNWVYTIRFKIKNSCSIIITREDVQGSTGAGDTLYEFLGFYVNGEDKRDDVMLSRRSIFGTSGWLILHSFNAGDVVELNITTGQYERAIGDVGGVNFYSLEPNKQVSFDGFIMYKGTPKYGTKNLLNQRSVIGYTNEDVDGGNVVIEREMYGGNESLKMGDDVVIGEILIDNSSKRGEYYSIEADEILIEPTKTTPNGNPVDAGVYIGFGDFAEETEPLTKVGNIDVNDLIRRSAIGMVVQKGRLSPVGKAISTVAKNKKKEFKVTDFKRVVYVPEGTGNRVRILSSGPTSGNAIKRIRFKGLRIYRGVAPIGVVKEGDTSIEGVDQRDLDTVLGRLHERIDGKADETHYHEMGDIRKLEETIERIEDELYKEPEELVVDMSSVTGLDDALSYKADREHSHQQSDIEGLIARLTGIENRLWELENN